MHGPRTLVAALALLVVATATATGCSSLAKLKLAGGDHVRGRIIGADEDAVYLEIDEVVMADHAACLSFCRADARRDPPDPDDISCEALCGEPGVVERVDLEGVDHPGEIQSIIGGTILGIGVALMVLGVVDTDGAGMNDSPWFGLGVTHGVVGGILLSTALPRMLGSMARLNTAPPEARLPDEE